MRKLIKNLKGMTLTEVVAAFAIIALVSLFMVTGFLSASVYITRANDIKNVSSAAYSRLEAGAAANSSTNGYIGFGSYGSVYGRTDTYTDSSSDCSVTYSEFTAQ